MKTESSQLIYEFGPFRLEENELRLTRAGQPLPLTHKAFQLLLILVRNAGHMLTKQELIDSIWPDTFVDEHNLVVHMSELRKILGSQQEYVATVARMGYRFVAEVRSSGDTAAHTFGNVAASRWNGFARQGVTSLAILPFKELRNKDEAEDPYLGIGLADGLITRLSALRNIVVRSTSAVRRYAGEGDPLAAARVLKVDLVLDGSLRRIGDRIRVTAQLLAVPDASTLWAGTYDECSADILALEDSLCEKVAASLVLELTSAENRRLTRHPTDNVRAYTSYMLGNALWSKHTPDDIGNSITYFEEAIRLDENFAAAYIGLARAKISLFAFSLIKLRDCYLEIEELLDRALELDCYLPEAHSYKAQLRHQIHLDWAAAEHEHQTAINVGHNCAFAYENYALYLAILGRTDEALALNQIAQVLEPTSLLFSISRGKILILGRQYQTAISELKPLVAVGKDPISYFILGLGYDMVGEYRKAQRLYTRYGGIHGVNPEVLAALCYSYASAGDLPKAREVLEYLVQLSQRQFVSACYLANAYLGLNDIDQTLSRLETAYNQQDSEVIAVTADPRYDKLRNHPRFLDLITRIKRGWSR